MNRKGSILKFVLIGIIIISVVLIGGVSYLYQAEIVKNNKLQTQVDELTARERATADKLEASKKKVTDLELKLQETKVRIASLSEELDQEKSARQASSKESEQIKADMEQQKISRQDIENKLGQVQNDSRKIKEQLKIMEQQKAVLEAKIKNLESGATGVELGKVVVNSEATDQSPKEENKPAKKNVNIPVSESPKVQKQEDSSQSKSLEGKVTVVNKEYSFVVINLGQKDGINIGDHFSVNHDGKVIGDIKVEKVHESMSAAGFAAELKDVIKENDLVVQKAK